MESLGTVNYLQKRVVNTLFNERWYNRIKLAKIIFKYKFGLPYEMSPLLKHLVSADSIVFDIGANMGQYACRFNHIVNQGKGHVHSFEPVSTNFEALQNMKNVLGLNKVTINKLGVSNVPGNTEIHIPMFDNGLVVGTRASILEMDQIRHRSESIKVTSIDSYFSEMDIERVDFIKCDTEGNESNVLEGGKQTITKFLPTLSFEMSYKSSNLGWLRDLGYDLYYYDAEANKLRKIKNTQKGNLIFIHQNQLKSLENIITEI